MKILLKSGLSPAGIHYIEQWLMSRGCSVHHLERPSPMGNLICAVSEGGDIDIDALRGLPGVERVERLPYPCKLGSRAFREEDTQIRVRNSVIGGSEIV